jgi:hypothetical protein
VGVPVIVTPASVAHRPPGDAVWTGGVLAGTVHVQGSEARRFVVGRLIAEVNDAIRIIALHPHPLLRDDQPVMLAGYVEHPRDGSQPVLIVTRVVPAGFDD